MQHPAPSTVVPSRAAAAAAATLLRCRVFLAWKLQVQRHRSLNSTADAFHLDSLQRSGIRFSVHWSTVLRDADQLRAQVWQRWRESFLRQRRERQQHIALMTLDAKSALRQWTRRVEWQSKLSNAEKAITERVHKRLLITCLDNWCRLTATHRSFTFLVSTVERVGERALQRRALNWMRLILHRESVLDSLVHRWERKRQRQVTRRTLLSWCSWSEVQRRLASHTALTSARRRMNVFFAWRTQTRRSRWLLSTADEFQSHTAEHTLQRIFTSWVGVLKAKIELAHRLFLRWREAMKERKQQQRRHDTLLQFDAHSALRFWAGCVARQRELERTESAVIRRHTRRIRMRFLSAWCQITASVRAIAFLTDTVQVIQDRVRQRRALHWIRFVARRDGSLDALTQRLMCSLQDRSILRALAQWRSSVLHARERAIRSQLHVTARQFAQSRALIQWKRRLVTVHTQSSKEQLILNRHGSSVKRALWIHWHEVMYARSFHRYEDRAIRRHRQSHVLRRWTKFMAYRSAVRGALAVADRASQSLLLAQSMRAWKFALKVRRFKLVCVDWLSAWVERRTLRYIIQVIWKEHTKLSKRIEGKLKRLDLLEKVSHNVRTR
jgi:hypothetical protein